MKVKKRNKKPTKNYIKNIQKLHLFQWNVNGKKKKTKLMKNKVKMCCIGLDWIVNIYEFVFCWWKELKCDRALCLSFVFYFFTVVFVHFSLFIHMRTTSFSFYLVCTIYICFVCRCHCGLFKCFLHNFFFCCCCCYCFYWSEWSLCARGFIVWLKISCYCCCGYCVPVWSFCRVINARQFEDCMH